MVFLLLLSLSGCQQPRSGTVVGSCRKRPHVHHRVCDREGRRDYGREPRSFRLDLRRGGTRPPPHAHHHVCDMEGRGEGGPRPRLTSTTRSATWRGGSAPASRTPPGLRPGWKEEGSRAPQKDLELRRGGCAPTSRPPPCLRLGGGYNGGEGPRPPLSGRNLHVTRCLLSHRGSRVGFVSTPTAGNCSLSRDQGLSPGWGSCQRHGSATNPGIREPV